MKIMNMTPKQYQELATERKPPSPIIRNVCLAFLIGGAICVIGQLIFNMFMSFGLLKQDAQTATSMTLIFLGAFFTGIHLYDKLAKFAGAGTIVPITGFANSIVSPAMEFKSEGLILGTGAKMFIVAGPVLVYGIATGVLYGLILIILKGI